MALGTLQFAQFSYGGLCLDTLSKVTASERCACKEDKMRNEMLNLHATKHSLLLLHLLLLRYVLSRHQIIVLASLVHLDYYKRL